MNKKLFFLFPVYFVLLCAASIVLAQDSDRLTKLRLAQGFEDSGEWERAVALYEDLCKLEPDNYQIANGLQRGYTQIKEYDRAKEVILNWLKLHPDDVNFAIQLGGLYYDSGNESAADSAWNSVLANNPNNVQLYRIVANEIMGHRLYDRCIRIYLKGREISKNEVQFADELGSIYVALQQYTSAAKEYIRFIKAAPVQLSFVQSRLNTFINRPEGLKSATEVLNAEVNNLPDNAALRRLFAWLLIEDRKYNAALEQYRIIDRVSNSKGNELYNFAQRLYQENVPSVAVEAFKEVIEEHKNSSFIPYARFGYARAIEELCNQSIENTSQSAYHEAIRLYESIASSYPNSDLTMQSLFRIGVIKYEKLFDLDGALNAFNQIVKLPQRTNVWFEASLKIGEVQVAKNSLTEARQEYESLINVPVVLYQYQASFKLAELNYFEAKFDSALSLLKRFNSNLNTDLTNDALQLQYFIQENYTSNPQGLKEFAEADLLMRRRKYSESLARFQDIVKNYPAALFVDDAMMKIGELHLNLQRPNEAISAFNFVLDSIQSSILQDRALFRTAEIYYNVLKNKEQAVSAYEKLLIRFPNSLYAEESRKRIRLLRGDSI
jgi:tetratricopeptide (TPR) repeat protein